MSWLVVGGLVAAYLFCVWRLNREIRAWDEERHLR